RFRIENFREGDETPVCVASAGDQDPAIGERGSGVSCARNNGIELLHLMRIRGTHPCGDRQHDDGAEEREKVSEDVISFGSSLHIRGVGRVWGCWGSLGVLGSLGGLGGG